MRQIKIGDMTETVVERADYPPERLRQILGNGDRGRPRLRRPGPRPVAQHEGQRRQGHHRPAREGPRLGPGRAGRLGARARRSSPWRRRPSAAPSSSTCSPTPARRSIGRASSRYLTAGKALYFSHGFSIVYSDQTGVVPPKDIDVILVAPKGSGTTVRRLFLEGKGINASYAIHQDATGRALDRCLALGIAIGSGYLFETTFQKEVFSDLTGERGVLMGAIYGLWLAQYEVLREHGHSPSEAFNETVEEATQSLYPLIAENGMDWMYANCSTTAQRGAWTGSSVSATPPSRCSRSCTSKVADGDETRRVLEANSRPDYRQQLEKELKAVADSEMWQAGTVVRSLRPERAAKSKG